MGKMRAILLVIVLHQQLNTRCKRWRFIYKFANLLILMDNNPVGKRGHKSSFKGPFLASLLKSTKGVQFWKFISCTCKLYFNMWKTVIFFLLIEKCLLKRHILDGGRTHLLVVKIVVEFFFFLFKDLYYGFPWGRTFKIIFDLLFFCSLLQYCAEEKLRFKYPFQVPEMISFYCFLACLNSYILLGLFNKSTFTITTHQQLDAFQQL